MFIKWIQKKYTVRIFGTDEPLLILQHITNQLNTNNKLQTPLWLCYTFSMQFLENTQRKMKFDTKKSKLSRLQHNNNIISTKAHEIQISYTYLGGWDWDTTDWMKRPLYTSPNVDNRRLLFYFFPENPTSSIGMGWTFTAYTIFLLLS